MSVKIGVTWEGLTRPTMARSLLSSLSPIVQDAVVFLNTVWLPPYARDVFSLHEQAGVCGIDVPTLPKLSFLHPGPTTPPTAFVPSASLRAVATELGKLLDRARELAHTSTRIRDNLSLLFAFDGFAFSDNELVALMDSKHDDPLTSLTDELRLSHGKTLVERLVQDDCRLYQITYGPYIFLRDDSPTLWGASRLVYTKEPGNPKDLERFFTSRAQQGKAIPWHADEAMLRPQDLSALTKVPLEALQWQPAAIKTTAQHDHDKTQGKPLTSCFVKIGTVYLTLALGKALESSVFASLRSAQDLNLMDLSHEVQTYWRHTILRSILGQASKRGDQRAYVLIVSGMDVASTVKAFNHYAKALRQSSVYDIVLVGLDRATVGEFAQALGCAIKDGLDIPLDDGLVQLLNHQAQEILK